MRQSGLVIVVLLSGCVSLGDYDSVAALRADAIEIFRQHNQVSAEVMLLAPDLDPNAAPTMTLMTADKAMLEACQPLNNIAVAHRDGKAVGLRKQRRLLASLNQCRAATSSTRLLLDQFE